MTYNNTKILLKKEPRRALKGVLYLEFDSIQIEESIFKNSEVEEVYHINFSITFQTLYT